MWSQYIRIMVWFQTLYPVRICVNKDTKRFMSTRRRNWYFYWGFIHIMLSVVVGFFRAVDYVRTPKNKVEMTFLDFVVEFFFSGTCAIFPAIFWTLRYKMDEYCWFLNQGYKLQNSSGNVFATICSLASFARN